MATQLTMAERDRRWRALSGAMTSQGYDALVFAAHDYRGHKGALRYVADYNLPHRYGYPVMAPIANPWWCSATWAPAIPRAAGFRTSGTHGPPRLPSATP